VNRLKAKKEKPAARLSFALFSKSLVIIFYRLIYNLYRLGAVAYLVNNRFLMLKILVNREEMAHFLKNMRGKLAYIGISVIGRVVKGYCDNLFVALAVVHH